HERKQTMADLADGFIALPGGAGTLEEIFEVWTWGQLGHHGKPVGFLNVGNYFDKLLAFLDHQTAERFMRQAHRDMLIVETDPDRMLDRCAVYTAPKVGKWIGEDER
ncbi:MAG TPA: TIGR00730 family Rossman fold protein, partial [Afifellaceae bacterium]|nr:TIGR00730 family Rossman fold protein [Afifellaceae bacterium]